MPGLLDWSRITGSVFPRKVGDGAIERNELVGFEVTLQVRIAGRWRGRVLQCRRLQGNLVLAPNRRKLQPHVKSSSGLLHCWREGRKRISVFGIVALDVTHKAINVQAANVLVVIGLRQGNPKMGGASGICVSGNMYLIGEFKRPRRRRLTRFSSRRGVSKYGNQGTIMKTRTSESAKRKRVMWRLLRGG